MAMHVPSLKQLIPHVNFRSMRQWVPYDVAETSGNHWTVKSGPVLAQPYKHRLSSNVSLKGEACVTVGAAEQQHQQLQHRHQHKI